MSIRQTRNAVQSGLVTPGPSRKVERYKAGSDEGSSTSAEESGGEAWNSKNDGAVIKQNHFGEKRRRAGRCKGVKTGPVKIDKRIKKRVKSESIDIESKGETMEDVASREEEEEMNATEEKEDEGNQAELEDDVLEQEAKTTTRRSGRPTKNPIRFDEERYQPFGGIARPMDKAYITKALVKLEESRAPSSRREFSSDGSPDPIASFSDDHDLVIDHPVDPSETSEIPILTLSNPVSENATPGKPKMGRPRKSALKPKVPSGSRKKRGKVIIDETKNQIRTIKVISSTSSDIGRHPLRGPKRFGVRSRRTVPVMGVSPYTGKRAVQSYTYETSSDSTESEDEEEIDPAEFREWIRLKREQEKKNGAFLLSLAARISDVPTSSSIPPPPTPPHVVPATLPTISEMPTWTRPFSLTPNRPPPPINPDHPSNQEQERVSSLFHRAELMIGMEYVRRYRLYRMGTEGSTSTTASQGLPACRWPSFSTDPWTVMWHRPLIPWDLQRTGSHG